MKDELAEIEKNWNPPAELIRSVPREVQLTRAGVAAMVLAFALFAAGIVAGIVFGSQAASERRRHQVLEAEGRNTESVITRLWRTGGKESHYRVSYTFDWEGRTYGGQSNVPRSSLAGLTQGGPLPIRVLPSDPEWSHPLGWPDRALSPLVPILSAAFFLVFAYFILRGLKRQKHLLAEGRPAPALILSSRKQHHGEGGSRTIITYEIVLPGGRRLKGRAQARRGQTIGTVHCAIYLPENPRRNALYPLDLARPAK